MTLVEQLSLKKYKELAWLRTNYPHTISIDSRVLWFLLGFKDKTIHRDDQVRRRRNTSWTSNWQWIEIGTNGKHCVNCRRRHSPAVIDVRSPPLNGYKLMIISIISISSQYLGFPSPFNAWTSLSPAVKPKSCHVWLVSTPIAVCLSVAESQLLDSLPYVCSMPLVAICNEQAIETCWIYIHDTASNSSRRRRLRSQIGSLFRGKCCQPTNFSQSVSIILRKDGIRANPG